MSVRVHGKEYSVKKDKLNLMGKGISAISEIEGLENLPDLRVLNLGGVLRKNHITEIKGLDALVNLQELDLGSNRITEIKGLDTLVNLQKLNLISNKITEIKGLDALVNLQELDLGYNQITEIKGLDTLVNLRKLDLSDNPITEIKGLGHLSHLQFLGFSIDASESQFAKIGGLDQSGNTNDPQAAVAYCRERDAPVEAEARKQKEQQAQAAERQLRLEGATDKLAKLVRVSESVKILYMAKMLGIEEEDLLGRLVDWAEQFGFTIADDVVKFGAGQKEDFIAQLEQEFSSWDKSAQGKDGKV